MNAKTIASTLSFSLALAVSAPAQLCFNIDQPLGNDNFGSRGTGQSFTPGVGLVPSAGANTALPLTEFTIYQGNSGANAPSTTTYLNIYDGDPNAGGSFIGSSTNSVDTNNPVFRRPMTWSFNMLNLSVTTEYWAVLSSTNSAGNLDIGCSLETQNRLAPNPYSGGSGLIAGVVPQAMLNDTRFSAEFAFVPAAFSTTGSGCAGSGGTPSISAAPGSLPRLGDSFTVVCDNIPQQTTNAFAALFFSRFTPPIDLTLVGMPGCTLYIPLEFVATRPNSGTSARWTLTMPTNQGLVGATLFYQWIVPDTPGTNALNLITSDLGQAVIGC